MNEIERVKTRRVFGNAVSGDFTEYTDYKLREDYRLMTELDRYLGKVEGQAYACQQVKEYLDANYMRKITLDELASRFFINKYYLLTLFKDRYGVTVNAYLNQMRVTYVKQQLRFTDRTAESLAAELHIEPAYLSRLFKKVEGVSPSEFRKSWKGDA